MSINFQRRSIVAARNDQNPSLSLSSLSIALASLFGIRRGRLPLDDEVVEVGTLLLRLLDFADDGAQVFDILSVIISHGFFE